MKTTKEDQARLTPSELEAIAQIGMRKSMRNLEDILTDVASGVGITKDEERLVDLLTFEKNGKRFGSFKNQKRPTPIPEGPVVIAEGGAYAKKEGMITAKSKAGKDKLQEVAIVRTETSS